jgi:hypothetical protein
MWWVLCVCFIHISFSYKQVLQTNSFGVRTVDRLILFALITCVVVLLYNEDFTTYGALTLWFGIFVVYNFVSFTFTYSMHFEEQRYGLMFVCFFKFITFSVLLNYLLCGHLKRLYGWVFVLPLHVFNTCWVKLFCKFFAF